MMTPKTKDALEIQDRLKKDDLTNEDDQKNEDDAKMETTPNCIELKLRMLFSLAQALS